MTENATATLTTYITDMHALVNHGVRTCDLQLQTFKDDHHPDALATITEIRRTLEGHLTLLDERAKALGGKTTQPIKDAVTAVTGVAAALISAVRAEPASKALRDGYTYLGHVAIGYLMLFTTASGLTDRETAALAERGYRDAARLVMQIDRVIAGVVIQELREDGLPVANVTDETWSMVVQAWKREAPTSGTGDTGNTGTSA